MSRYDAIVMGASAGGLQTWLAILADLPTSFPLPLIIVQHRSRDERNLLEDVLSQKCQIGIRQANEKEKIEPGNVYFASPDYHLLIERNHTFSLSGEERVNYSRPAIDLLFETAAYAYQNRLLAIIFTGANQDGAAGISQVRKMGGTTIAQNPATAAFPVMPQAAIATGAIQQVLGLDDIRKLLLNLGKVKL
jgi:two-component system, chemotaxis family, protein-glutamate methylesterase/glutaminase